MSLTQDHDASWQRRRRRVWSIRLTVGSLLIILTIGYLALNRQQSNVAIPTDGEMSFSWHHFDPGPLTPRSGFAAVWNGIEMIVWGGLRSSPEGDPFFADGAAYNPEHGTWRLLPKAPQEGAGNQVAVWTGSEMLVWGGQTLSGQASSGAYNPATNRWRPIAKPPFKTRWSGVTGVWTGDEWIVWGGWPAVDGEPSGAAYDPDLDSWRPLDAAPFNHRAHHTATWTGSVMVVAGGMYINPATGVFEAQPQVAQYDPQNDEWDVIASPLEAAMRWRHSSVWDGQQVRIWGGETPDESADGASSGHAYSPSNTQWTSWDVGEFGTRVDQLALWSGRQIVAWGGSVRSGSSTWDPFSDGFVFDDNGFVDIAEAPLRGDRRTSIAAWTGAELLVWGLDEIMGHQVGVVFGRPDR